ncbi:MAG: transposase [Planctomycetales bacterium]|nr:transposase [Planctomycetales bacterium]
MTRPQGLKDLPGFALYGRQLLSYLDPYVFRVAIGNHRIRRVQVAEDGTGKVTYMAKPSKLPSYRPGTSSPYPVYESFP